MLSVLGRRWTTLFCFVFYSLFAAQQAYGQFTTIINVPPDFAPSSIGNDTQLNLFDAGVIVSNFNAGSSFGTSENVEVNISGGTVGSAFDANGGSVVNIFGGAIGNSFDANNGSEVNISGGTVERFFRARSGSVVNISGGSFVDDFNTNGGSLLMRNRLFSSPQRHRRKRSRADHRGVTPGIRSICQILLCQERGADG